MRPITSFPDKGSCFVQGLFSRNSLNGFFVEYDRKDPKKLYTYEVGLGLYVENDGKLLLDSSFLVYTLGFRS